MDLLIKTPFAIDYHVRENAGLYSCYFVLGLSAYEHLLKEQVFKRVESKLFLSSALSPE